MHQSFNDYNQAITVYAIAVCSVSILLISNKTYIAKHISEVCSKIHSFIHSCADLHNVHAASTPKEAPSWMQINFKICEAVHNFYLLNYPYLNLYQWPTGSSILKC